MSSRGRRLTQPRTVSAFDWSNGAFSGPQLVHSNPARVPAETSIGNSAAETERDAFAKGYSQGERAGAEAAAQRGEAMLRRLTQTLEELTTLRSEMIHQTERQLVQLALAV